MSRSTMALALTLLAAAGCNDSTGTVTPRASYTLPGDNVFPEGIASQPSSNFFFVSGNADGTIFRGDLAQAALTTFLPPGADGRTSAAGMKVDAKGRLFIAGAGTGSIFVYNAQSGALIKKLTTDARPTFLNDVAIAPGGVAYITDSFSPVLYRVADDASGVPQLERWLNFSSSTLIYGDGFNANGIVATPDGNYLILVQTNTGKLFRVTVATKAVLEITLIGGPVTNGDGLLLREFALYVVRNQQKVIARVNLGPDYATGTVASSTSDPSFDYPTTIAEAGGRFLVVNAQLDKRQTGATPTRPFTISSVPIP